MALSIPNLLRNPIFEREFVALCRSRRWFVVRALLIGLLTVVLWVFLLFVQDAMSASETDQIGQMLFAACVFVQVTFVYFVTPALVSDLIVSERRKETLDILLVSPLSATGIILGKLLSRLSLLFVIVAASFPVISVTLLYGGVRAEQVFGLFLVTLGTILFTAGPALLFSCLARRLGTAAVLAYIAPLAFMIGSPFIAWAFDPDFEDAARWMMWTNVYFAATAVAVDDLFMQMRTVSPSPAMGMFLTGTGTCLFCTLIAIFRLRRESRTRGFPGAPAKSVRAETDLLRLRNRIILLSRNASDVHRAGTLATALEGVDGALAEIASPGTRPRSATAIVNQLRSRLEELGVDDDRVVAGLAEHARGGRRHRLFRRMENPVLWKEINLVNTSQSPVLFYVVLALLLLSEALFFFVVLTEGDLTSALPHVFLVTGQALLLLILISVNSATSVIGEKEQGTLDLLRITLVTPREVIRGKLAGSLRSIFILALIPILHLTVLTPFTNLTLGSAFAFAAVLSVLLTFFAVYGIRASIVASRASRAILRSMGVLGGILVAVPLAILLMAVGSGSMNGEFIRFLLFSNPLAMLFLPVQNFSHAGGTDDELIGYVFAWLFAYLLATGFLYFTLPQTFRKHLSRVD